MSKSFAKIECKLLHPLGVVSHGKYAGCRLDTVIDMHPGYCLWMHNNGYWTLGKEALSKAKNMNMRMDKAVNDEDDKAYLEDQYGPFLEMDVPF